MLSRNLESHLLLHGVLHHAGLVGVDVVRGEELGADGGLADPGPAQHHHPVHRPRPRPRHAAAAAARAAVAAGAAAAAGLLHTLGRHGPGDAGVQAAETCGLQRLYLKCLDSTNLDLDELTLLFLDLKESPLLITFFPDVEKFL